MLFVILDIKGLSLHDWLHWIWLLYKLINPCWLAWHLAVVSHWRIMVGRWSSPMAQAFMWIHLEKTFFSTLRISSRQVDCSWSSSAQVGCLSLWGWWLCWLEMPLGTLSRRGSCGTVLPSVPSKPEKQASNLSATAFCLNDFGIAICNSVIWIFPSVKWRVFYHS